MFLFVCIVIVKRVVLSFVNVLYKSLLLLDTVSHSITIDSEVLFLTETWPRSCLVGRR